ncbi:hypothetical protein F511_11537 [Dorcoceras hygrometricum]|uniref:Disease resistance R13L4/SHOC-2-like LRR domain-containing protein n=1 Tax=Dorcoceras hygrometricum TaxID=472368 RepID=A0A2Z7ALI2_9LAMI|nr:hypothetical protein F511_11537 [Dorcoceras hygrometricum]
MASAPATANPPPAYAEAIDEITRIYKSLPPRPSIEVVEAAVSVVQTVETEKALQLEDISKEPPPEDVPPELFSMLQEVRKSMVLFRCLEQKKEASHLIEQDRIFQVFDDLIRKASALVSGDSEKENDSGSVDDEFEESIVMTAKTCDEVETKIVANDLKSPLPRSSKTDAIVPYSGKEEAEKLDVLDVAAIIENSSKTKANILDLRSKLMDKVEWLPLSLGKLSTLTELYLSENRIMALPTSIADLSALMKLDVRGNQLINLPSSFGGMRNLTDVDLSANMLKSLPESFGSLTSLINLDLSSNRFSSLPDVVGNLTSLKRLNLKTNVLEELPYTIGLCSSLVELRLDFNNLKALPEGTGQLEQLEILTFHYNRVKRLPSTIGNLSHLRELDASFNELESIPETLCFCARLEKLNIGKNFADLRSLPESLGELEVLGELDISDNQIKTLPDSFRFLSKLTKFRADQTPLEVPPMQITKMGAQARHLRITAAVQYMADLVAERDAVSKQPKKKRGFCSYICPLLCFGVGK